MKLKNIVLSFSAALLLQFPVLSHASGVTSNEAHVNLKVNDYYVLYTTPKAPYIDSHNRFMIPLRSVSELLGANVKYEPKSKKATISMDSKTVTFTTNSKIISVNGSESTMDTVPVLYKNSLFIPLGFLTGSLKIENKWDSAKKLFELTGDNLMQTDLIKNYEDLDVREGPVKSNNAFLPTSYELDQKKYSITIKSKNITGQDLPKGVEDVHPYFIFDSSAVFDTVSRTRPAVKKDGFTEYTWKFTPTIIDGKEQNLKYILVKGRLFDSN